MMSKSRFLIAAAALSVTALFLSADVSLAAAKKVSLAKAWQTCKAELDSKFGKSTDQNASQRYAAGAACLQRYGHSL